MLRHVNVLKQDKLLPMGKNFTPIRYLITFLSKPNFPITVKEITQSVVPSKIICQSKTQGANNVKVKTQDAALVKR